MSATSVSWFLVALVLVVSVTLFDRKNSSVPSCLHARASPAALTIAIFGELFSRAWLLGLRAFLGVSASHSGSCVCGNRDGGLLVDMGATLGSPPWPVGLHNVVGLSLLCSLMALLWCPQWCRQYSEEKVSSLFLKLIAGLCRRSQGAPSRIGWDSGVVSSA
jgi:hypothetical protein